MSWCRSELANYTLEGWSCTSGLSDSTVTLAANDVVTCTATNTDKILPPAIGVNKTLNPPPFGCPVIIGTKAGYFIEVDNFTETAMQDVILYDQWSEQLKPAKTPDVYECTQTKPRTLHM